jgi:hypothetical protein
LPLLAGDDATANRYYMKEFVLARDRELGNKYGVEYAEVFYYIAPGASRVEDYIREHSAPLKERREFAESLLSSHGAFFITWGFHTSNSSGVDPRCRIGHRQRGIKIVLFFQRLTCRAPTPSSKCRSETRRGW